MRVAAIIGFFVLTACGGSSTGSSEALSRSERAARLESQVTSDEVSRPDKLPNNGNATYAGFMTARLPTGSTGGRRDYIGDLDMEVDFGADRNQVTGRARNFTNSDGANLDGRLRIRGGDLYRNTDPDENYTFTGNVDGTLTKSGAPYAIDAEIEGEFRGRRRTGISGLIFGDVKGPLGQDIFDGDFFASMD